jgi:hypothetical protein
MSDTIIIINYWGGIPSCLVKKSLSVLNHFKSFSLGGTCFTNAYVTNTDPYESFKDFICNKRMNGFPMNKRDSIFNDFKNNGYKTILLGCFGLDENMNPNPPRREYIDDARYSLEELGIDRFSAQDGCYHTGSSYSHDEKVLLEANEILINMSVTEGPLLLFINLLGCNDCYKRRFDEPTLQQHENGISKKKWYLNPDVNDVRLVPTNVGYNKVTEWKQIFETSKRMENNKYGEPFETTSTIDPKIKFLSLQASAWSDLIKLDDLIIRILKNARQKFSGIKTCILSTNVVSLEEHGIRSQAPVEPCCKSFWIYSNNDLDRPVEEESQPTNLLNFWGVFIEKIYTNNVFSLCLLPSSNLDLKNNCLRNIVNVRGKTYSVNYIWSLNELLKMNNTTFAMSSNKTQWTVRLKDIVSVFDLIEDNYETNNILELCSLDLLEEFSKNAELNQTIYMNIKNLKKETEEIVAVSEVENVPENRRIPNQALLRAQRSRLQTNERREELSKQETLKQETLKQETLKQETLKQEALKQEALKQEALKQEALNMKQMISEVSEKPKGILRFDTNPPKVWEFERYTETTDIKKGNTKNLASKLRKRESDLNQKHR